MLQVDFADKATPLKYDRSAVVLEVNKVKQNELLFNEKNNVIISKSDPQEVTILLKLISFLLCFCDHVLLLITIRSTYPVWELTQSWLVYVCVCKWAATQDKVYTSALSWTENASYWTAPLKIKRCWIFPYRISSRSMCISIRTPLNSHWAHLTQLVSTFFIIIFPIINPSFVLYPFRHIIKNG